MVGNRAEQKIFPLQVIESLGGAELAALGQQLEEADANWVLENLGEAVVELGCSIGQWSHKSFFGDAEGPRSLGGAPA